MNVIAIASLIWCIIAHKSNALQGTDATFDQVNNDDGDPLFISKPQEHGMHVFVCSGSRYQHANISHKHNEKVAVYKQQPPRNRSHTR